MSKIHASARELIGYHLSVIPAKDKRPVIKSWAPYQQKIMAADEISVHFNGAPQLAVICGKVSDNLEVIDIDLKYDTSGNLWERFKNLIDNHDPDLLGSLVMQKTVSNGVHLLYRCQTIEGNQKLASRKDNIVLIETRGEGGYIIAAPSDGYKLLDGRDFGKIPCISVEQRELLLSAARSFNEKVTDSPRPKTDSKTIWEISPGDAFDKECDMEELLCSYGWSVAAKQGDAIWFLRPGDTKAAHSANWNVIEGRFWCWSTSTAFNAETLYKPYAVFAILECGGDYSKAASILYSKGFGKKKQGAEEQEIINYVLKDEYGLAQLFAARQKGKALFDHYHKAWRTYQEGIWAVDEKKALLAALPAMLQKEIAKATKYLTDQITASINEGKNDEATAVAATQKTLFKQAAALNKRAVADNVQAIARNFLPVLTTELDIGPHLINCKNGTFNCRDFVFSAHSPADLLSKQTSVFYDPSASCPKWKEFIATVFQNDKGLISFVQRAIGYTFTGLSDMQALLFCYGSGGNGKTIFFSVLQAILQDYYSSIPIETLLSKQKNQTDEYHMAGLKGARCVVASEIPEGRKLNESQIKDITGGEHIIARVPYGMPYSYAPTHTLWMFGNHKPIIKGTDNGIWRRMYLIPFTYTVPKEQRKDKNRLLAELLSESAGIFNWAMEGLLEYDRIGLSPPAAVLEATEEYKEDSNNFKTFIKERCRYNKVDTLTKTAVKILFEKYSAWCLSENEQSIFKSSRFMAAFLRQENYRVEEAGQRVLYVYGLEIIQQEDEKIQDNIF